LNCREALQLLYDIVDKEASQIDAGEVEKHLKSCRHCLAKYEFEQMFKTFVIEKGKNVNDNSHLKNNILAKLDDIDAAREVGADRRPFKWMAVSLAAAATIIFCILAANALDDYFHHQSEIAPFIKAHFTQNPESRPEDPISDPFAYLYEQTGIKMDRPMQLPIDRIRSASVDTIKGVEFGHLEVFGENNTLVSIFVTQKDRYHLPTKPVESINGFEMLVHTCEKCSMVGLSKGDLVFVLVSRPDYDTNNLVQISTFF
jgi:anti-sigma factor (TIGR02949 family)